MLASFVAALAFVLAPFTQPTQPPPLPSAPLEIGEITVHQILDYAAYSDRVRVGDYLVSLTPPEPVQDVSGPSTQVVGACGGATNGADQYIGRESGGNPAALNPSGAWGCYQIMPGTWAGAGCDQLGAYGSAPPSVQAECASRLPLSAWGG